MKIKLRKSFMNAVGEIKKKKNTIIKICILFILNLHVSIYYERCLSSLE